MGWWWLDMEDGAVHYTVTICTVLAACDDAMQHIFYNRLIWVQFTGQQTLAPAGSYQTQNNALGSLII